MELRRVTHSLSKVELMLDGEGENVKDLAAKLKHLCQLKQVSDQDISDSEGAQQFKSHVGKKAPTQIPERIKRIREARAELEAALQSMEDDAESIGSPIPAIRSPVPAHEGGSDRPNAGVSSVAAGPMGLPPAGPSAVTPRSQVVTPSSSKGSPSSVS